MTKLEADVKNIHVEDKLSDLERMAKWIRELQKTNECAKNKVIDAIDGGLKEAVRVIEALPDKIQDIAAEFFTQGMSIVVEAFEYQVQKM